MAFTDTFAGTTNDPLSGRPGWALAYGEEALLISANGGLKKKGTTTSQTWYPRTGSFQQGNGAIQRGGCNPRTGSGTTAYGKVIFGSGTAGAFSGYRLNILTNGGLVVRRIYPANQTGDFIINNVTAPAGNGDNVEMEGIVAPDGSKVTINLYQNGSATPFATYQDTNVNRSMTGVEGLLIGGNGSLDPVLGTYTDSGIEAALAINTPAFPFYAGLRNPFKMTVSGTYTSVSSIDARLIDAAGNPVPGFDWTNKVPATSGGTFAFTFDGTVAGQALGGPYRVQVRDAANPAGSVVTGLTERYVAVNGVAWGQSQQKKLMTETLNNSQTPVNASARVWLISTPSGQQNPQTPTLTRVQTTDISGYGLHDIANEWYARVGNVPLVINCVAITGQSITKFADDLPPDAGSGATWTTAFTAFGTTPQNGYVMQMLAAMDFRWDFELWMQGTADMTAVAGYPAKMDQLAGKFDAVFAGGAQLPLRIVVPHQRSIDGGNMFAMRNAQYLKATSGGRWRFGAWLLDWQMDGDGAAHQIAGPTGQARGGRRIGRGLAKVLMNPLIDNVGPQIINADLSADRTQITLTFDQDVELADGTVFNGTPIALVPQFNTSNDNGTTFDLLSTPTQTAQLTGLRNVVMTKTGGGTWTLGQARVDYLRGTPYASAPQQGTTTDYMGVLGTVTVTANTTAGSNILTVTALTGTINIGDSISGPGLPAGSSVQTTGSSPGTYAFNSQQGGGVATTTATGVTLTVQKSESLMEQVYLSKLITDRDQTFDGGRGMPLAPVMGIGKVVSLPILITATNATGSSTLRVRPAS